MFYLQDLFCGALDVFSDLMAMRGGSQEGAENEHVKSALEKARALLCLLRHRRQSTLTLALMVDARPSLVKECPTFLA